MQLDDQFSPRRLSVLSHWIISWVQFVYHFSPNGLSVLSHWISAESHLFIISAPMDYQFCPIGLSAESNSFIISAPMDYQFCPIGLFLWNIISVPFYYDFSPIALQVHSRELSSSLTNISAESHLLIISALCIISFPRVFSFNFRTLRSQRPRALRRGSAAARLLRLWVRIPPGAWMSVCCECCVLSGRGLCDGLITRPEESYWIWFVWMWSRNLVNEEDLN
jgi:hypothetical protein